MPVDDTCRRRPERVCEGPSSSSHRYCISHPACRVTVLGGKGNYPDGVPARLGQRKVVSLLLLQSHEPACSRIGAPLILHDTIHPHPFELPTLGGKCCTALFVIRMRSHQILWGFPGYVGQQRRRNKQSTQSIGP